MKWTKKELEASRLLTHSSRCKNCVNHIEINTHSTYEHESKKFEICWFLARCNKKFYTESIFENGSRADIVNVTDLEIIEVLHSETDKHFKEKIKKYPKQFKIKKVRV